MCQGNLKNAQFFSCINIINDWIYMNCITKNCGNKNSPTFPTKKVKYYYPDEIAVNMRYFPSVIPTPTLLYNSG